MELLTKCRNTRKTKELSSQYKYAYRVKNGKIVEFIGDDAVKKEFDIHNIAKQDFYITENDSENN